jgi:probable HAF family extracellular repeat protein
MIPQTNKPAPLPSTASIATRDSAAGLRHYGMNDGYKTWILCFIILIAVGAAYLVLAEDAAHAKGKSYFARYQVLDEPSLGGTNSRANSINNRAWLAGYSNLPGNGSRHAALWRDGVLTDLGTLGGPNSAVTWSVKANSGIIAGISQTAMADPLGEAWSSAAFYPGATGSGFINLGFVWENGVMRALPTLGGNNGFATGANSRGEVVGWAENSVRDPTCVPPQQLQFRPVVYGKKSGDISELPLVPGDTSGAATGINERGDAVGISGICDQAVGRYTARHAVVWDKHGGVTDIGNLGAPWWNTPTNINQRGDVVGFAGAPNDPDGNFLQAFIWTAKHGMQALGFLPGDVHSEAYGINEKRQVVGLSCDADGNCRAFIWESGVMKDMNDLKPASYAARLEQARDINEAGEIAGRSIDAAGVRKAFLAVPAHGH